MIKKILTAVTAVFIINTYSSYGHCEIPCGIYGDETRVHLLLEHVATIEKSMKKIEELSGKDDPQSKNQLVRWIDNKEKHAQEFQYIVWQYFMTQRVKPVDPSKAEEYKKYIKKLELLHQMSFYAMKAKQSLNIEYTDKLRKLIKEFEKEYFGNHLHKH
ncbi:superoxide dismutase [Ni] [Persephonella sp.]